MQEVDQKNSQSAMGGSPKHPFFVVGCPRSGTTLLQLLIDSHPNIAIPPESHIFVRFSSIFQNYGDLNQETNIRLFINDLLKDYHIRDWNLQVSVDEFYARLNEYSLRSVISLLMELYAVKDGKKRWGDKTPQHALYLPEIKKVFPDAKFIHLIRDGRDVAVSSSRIFVGPPSIYGIAREWKTYILTFEEFKKELNQSEYHELYYRELVKNPKTEINNILNFLGEEGIDVGRSIPNGATKYYYLNTDHHMSSLNSPISTDKIAKFKTKLTRREIEIFESVAGEELELHKFELMTNKKQGVNRTEKIRFLFKDKVYRYYRKYFRPTEFDKAWILFRREVQYHLRRIIRSRRRPELHNRHFTQLAKKDAHASHT